MGWITSPLPADRGVPAGVVYSPAVSRAHVTRVLLILLAAAALFLFVPLDALREFLDPEQLRARAATGGNTVIVGYLGAAALLAAMTGQQALPVIAGAALFGPVLGPVLAVLGVGVGSTAQFYAIRYAFRESALRLLEARAPALASNLEARGLAVLVLLRFIWFPMGVTTMGAALTSVPGRLFLLGFPAMLPQAFIWAFGTDAIVTYGIGGVPPLRWAALAGMVAAAVGGYLVAVRRWPELRAVRRTRPPPPGGVE